MMWGQEGKKFIAGGLINDASGKAYFFPLFADEQLNQAWDASAGRFNHKGFDNLWVAAS